MPVPSRVGKNRVSGKDLPYHLRNRKDNIVYEISQQIGIDIQNALPPGTTEGEILIWNSTASKWVLCPYLLVEGSRLFVKRDSFQLYNSEPSQYFEISQSGTTSDADAIFTMYISDRFEFEDNQVTPANNKFKIKHLGGAGNALCQIDNLGKFNRVTNINSYITNNNKYVQRSSDTSIIPASSGANVLTLSSLQGVYEIEFMIYVTRSTFLDTDFNVSLTCSDTGVTAIKGILEYTHSTANTMKYHSTFDLMQSNQIFWTNFGNMVRGKAVYNFPNSCSLNVYLFRSGTDVTTCQTSSFLKAVKLS